MIRLFACDLDGTLLNFFHQVDGTVLKAIRAVSDAGLEFAVATGRTMRAAQRREFGFGDVRMHSVGMNGAMVYNADDELIYAKPLKKDLLEELLKAFPDIGFECVGYDHIFVTDSRERHAVYGGRKGLMGLVMRPMRAKFLAGCRFDQTMADILGRDILKVNCHVRDPARERDLKDFVAAHADRVVNAPFDPCMFELTDKDVNKGTAVAYLARYLGIEEGEVAVYGDGGNDLEMLGRFKHAYATSNGSDAAKRAAGNVIGNCAFYAVPRHIMRTVRAQR